MPIVVTHQPSIQTLAKAGYYAGAGEAMQMQQRMAAEQQMQERRMQADMINRQMAAGQAVQQQKFELERMRFGKQLNMQQMQEDHALRVRLEDLNHRNQLEAIKIERDNRLAAEELANENAATRDQATFFRGAATQTKDRIQGMLDSGMAFTPEDEQLYKTKLKAMDAIIKDKTLKPWPRAQALFELSNELPLPTIRPPSAKEIIDEQLQWVPDPNDPTGRRKIAVSIGRNGEVRSVYEPKDPPQEKDTSADDQRQFTELYMKVREQLRESVNESTGQKTIREVPHEEIMAVIRQMQDGAGESQPIQFKRDPKTGALTPQ
jgi:hypothetical protein